MTLGETNAGCVCDQRAMIESRWNQAKSSIQKNLSGGGFEEILAANDFGNLHCGIVNHDGELIRRDLIVSPDDKIAEVFAGDELLWTKIGVRE